jgi:hypothetical protein
LEAAIDLFCDGSIEAVQSIRISVALLDDLIEKPAHCRRTPFYRCHNIPGDNLHLGDIKAHVLKISLYLART